MTSLEGHARHVHYPFERVNWSPYNRQHELLRQKTVNSTHGGGYSHTPFFPSPCNDMYVVLSFRLLRTLPLLPIPKCTLRLMRVFISVHPNISAAVLRSDRFWMSYSCWWWSMCCRCITKRHCGNSFFRAQGPCKTLTLNFCCPQSLVFHLDIAI